MKIKCVYTDEDYLTIGKEYPVINLADDERSCESISDSGAKIFVYLPNSSHGDFELIEDKQEEPMNTKELKPRDLGCFRQVADVIGEYAAEVELQKVIDSESTCWDFPDEDLLASFVWSSTPQGGLFWNSIDNGQTPEESTPPPAPVEPPKQAEEQPKKSQPEFGDVLHINGSPRVYLSKWGSSGAHRVTSEDGQVSIVDLKEIDEYAPNPHQEQRERILKRWQRKSLEQAHDTEVCIAEMRVSDLIDFVQENILAET